ncbi:ORF6N domain-containing protein [Niabella drilacis]|uniref:ORF6N domain-containing protein n=1 Tax=Niabella drilacis (strain DSM 25811 / CCM 8410 / CCUG 62505 / LMG 26954 / E90) TaxID=1285928 RepID=A0A1G6YT02_NIADE|nr:ORF6N domain-containing protein [Niabella drilacis]SDD93539.1 ORF6N domain-containing protein [Niabella drilacis]
MQLTFIQQRIYEVREQRVMMDYDLAHLYQIETKRLKEAVRRNRNRFPEDFMFELAKEEYDLLRSQFATSNRGGRRYMPFAFTEHGVAMLASVLNSDKAIEMNIAIVRAFIALRELALYRGDFLQQLQSLRNDLHHRIDVHDAQLSQIYEALEKMLNTEAEKKAREEAWNNRKRVGYK